jgi:hypothetical protein
MLNKQAVKVWTGFIWLQQCPAEALVGKAMNLLVILETDKFGTSLATVIF